MKKRQETEIDVLDLLKNICYHWRSVLAFMIVFALLAGGYCVAKNISTNRTLKQQVRENKDTMPSKDTSDEDIALIDVLAERGGLTETEKYNVKMAVGLYAILQEYYNAMDDESGQSVFSNEDRLVLQFVLRAKGDSATGEDVVNTVGYAIDQYVANGGLSATMKESGFEALTVDEINNCISIKYNATMVQKIQSEKDDASMIPLIVICKGTDEEKRRELGEGVKVALEEFVQGYEQLGQVELILLGEYQGQATTVPLLRKNVEEYNEFNNFVNGFSDTQKAIFNEMVGTEALTIGDASVKEILSVSKAEEKEMPEVSVTLGVSKYIVMGLLLGLFLAMAWYGIIYILFGTVKTKEEMEHRYGQYSLGNLAENADKTGIDKVLQRFFEGNYDKIENRRKLAGANIKAICNKQNIKRIAITSSILMSDIERGQLDMLLNELGSAGIKVVYVGNILEDVTGFETLLNAEGVVLFERLGFSKRKALDRIDDICEEHQINVLGGIYC